MITCVGYPSETKTGTSETLPKKDFPIDDYS